MKTIDLRSDTVTLPTTKMLDAIRGAELGDDVFEEDPTTNRLQKMAAERVGKEAGLLVPSGTMGNLASILAHCSRGEEVILGDRSHTFLYEAGGIAALGGVHPHTIPNQPDGTMRLEDIDAAIRRSDVHFPRSKLICLENTHNRCGGSPLTPEYTDRVAELADRFHLSVHLDGARVFNAAQALGVDVRELTRGVQSVTFCLSKGLSCPVGSVICGAWDFIEDARHVRKMLGGGMRQCGIIAAAGIQALDGMVDRLAEDHANARRLAEGIAGIPGLSIDPDCFRTNIVYFEFEDGSGRTDLVERMAERGVRLLQTGVASFRMVTHYGISSEDVGAALEALADVMKQP